MEEGAAVRDGDGELGPLARRTYLRVREMAMTYALKPGERVNESDLARRLDVSRTPLREAMSRLVSEGLLTVAGRGFSTPPLDVKEVFDLYETRLALETSTVRLACERIAPEAVAGLRAHLAESARVGEAEPLETLLRLDEGFHERLAAASGNGELERLVRALNRRIHFVRWIDMEGRRGATQADHRAILDAVAAGDADTAVAVIRPHIERRLDQIVDVIKEGHARLGMGGGMSGSWGGEARPEGGSPWTRR